MEKSSGGYDVTYKRRRAGEKSRNDCREDGLVEEWAFLTLAFSSNLDGLSFTIYLYPTLKRLELTQ
jgi:hypothetical protein